MFAFLRTVFFPLSQRPVLVLWMFFGSLLHSCGNALLLLLVGPFAKVLFGAGGQESVDLAQMVPFLTLQPWFVDYELLVKLVPAGMVLAAVVRSLGGYIFQRYSEQSSAYIGRSFRDHRHQTAP